MAIFTQITADPHALDILRDGVRVGFISWHSSLGKGPRITFTQAFNYLTLDELKSVLAAYEQHRSKSG